MAQPVSDHNPQRLQDRRNPGQGRADGVHADRCEFITRIVCCGTTRNEDEQHSTQLAFNSDTMTLTILDSRPNHETTLNPEHARELAEILYRLTHPSTGDAPEYSGPHQASRAQHIGGA